MTQERDQRLRAWIDPPALAAEGKDLAGLRLLLRRKLFEHGLVDRQIDAGVATLDRVADSISLA